MLKTYKQTLEKKKDKFHRDKIDEIIKATETDLNTFWKTLKTTSDDVETNSHYTPNEDELLEHFQQLHSTHNLNPEHNHIIENLKSIEKTKDQFNELDAPITENELLNAVKKIKLKKTAYSERISNEIIKASSDILIKGFVKAFNIILKSENFPKAWCEGLITPIFKSGNHLDPNNYRGICVSSCLGKLFCIILNERLMSHVQDRELIHPSQIGFMPGSRTTDHILTLKTLHDKYVIQQNSGKIYTCFVDFRKAFDSAWHEGLLLKLLQNKIGGKFYDLIKNLYSNTQCAIKYSNHRTAFFPYKKGVRQGCILSPLLFNFYLNELPKIFQNTSSDPFVLPDGTTVSSLIYADDLVILSKSKNGLQNCLNKLHEWSKKWLMEINMKKTKIMIFQKYNSKKNLKNINFTLGNSSVDITNEYTYLGIKLTPNAKFSITHQQLSEKAMHALYKIRRHLDFHALKPKIAIKIFDSIISPILLYGSEVWGAYSKNDFKNWDKTPIEKTHLKFCKLSLGINRKASNLASRGELGKFSLLIPIIKRILNYIYHLNQLPDKTIAKQAFLLSKQLHSEGRESFYSNIINTITSHYDNSDKPFDLETKIENSGCNEIIKNVKHNYITFWKEQISKSSNLSFYSTFKKEYKLEEYLNNIENKSQRKILTQFRISNHKLKIEYGRYQNIPRDERLCNNCNMQTVEDEFHFVFDCQCYETKRNNSNIILKNMLKLELTSESKQNLLGHIISSSDQVIVNLFSKYLLDCFTMRDKCLESPTSMRQWRK